MKSIFAFTFILTILCASCQQNEKPQRHEWNDVKDIVLTKLKANALENDTTKLNPRSTNADGTVHFVAPRDWTSGFYPGCLWYAYELSKDEKIKQFAINRTEILENQKYNKGTHDMGFKMFCSYGNAYRLTGNPEYKTILLQSATTLCTRFNPTVGCIRSWDHNSDKWEYPVIIDNMMNLELLMWAFHETADSTFYTIAVSHANTTIKNHFRPDYSCYHVIGYDTITGAVIKKNTHQGLSDSSSWARGQAWALYGYTMMYRETKIEAYLQQAENVAQFILSHKNMPEDLIPYWDFDAPNIPNEPRDASAAAVICSALYELSSFSTQHSSEYSQSANKILSSLCSNAYLAAPNQFFILEHSTGSFPHNSEIDVPLIYADYYFLEALQRKETQKN